SREHRAARGAAIAARRAAQLAGPQARTTPPVATVGWPPAAGALPRGERRERAHPCAARTRAEASPSPRRRTRATHRSSLQPSARISSPARSVVGRSTAPLPRPSFARPSSAIVARHHQGCRAASPSRRHTAPATAGLRSLVGNAHHTPRPQQRLCHRRDPLRPAGLQRAPACAPPAPPAFPPHAAAPAATSTGRAHTAHPTIQRARVACVAAPSSQPSGSLSAAISRTKISPYRARPARPCSHPASDLPFAARRLRRPNAAASAARCTRRPALPAASPHARTPPGDSNQRPAPSLHLAHRLLGSRETSLHRMRAQPQRFRRRLAPCKHRRCC
ncbi:hypothetical protein BDY21DRAFT_403317, partial [Lineolata rhizophorae]